MSIQNVKIIVKIHVYFLNMLIFLSLIEADMARGHVLLFIAIRMIL